MSNSVAYVDAHIEVYNGEEQPKSCSSFNIKLGPNVIKGIFSCVSCFRKKIRFKNIENC